MLGILILIIKIIKLFVYFEYLYDIPTRLACFIFYVVQGVTCGSCCFMFSETGNRIATAVFRSLSMYDISISKSANCQ